MSHESVSGSPDQGAPWIGPGLGLIGVTIFGLTLPFTRLAVAELDPFFVAFGRAVVAAVLAACVLVVVRPRLPDRADLFRYVRYSLGVVVGFPLFATLAMTTASAAHGGVVLAILPLATAVASTLVAAERPSIAFWLCAVAGCLVVLTYVMLGLEATKKSEVETLYWADLYLLAAILSAAIGYTDGGVLARKYGGWQTISWALVLSAPFMVLLVALQLHQVAWSASVSAWAGFGYVSVFSMFIGFFAWNRGLAIGGIARVGQLMLLQPFVTLAASAWLISEPVASRDLYFACAVALVVFLSWQTQIKRG